MANLTVHLLETSGVTWVDTFHDDSGTFGRALPRGSGQPGQVPGQAQGDAKPDGAALRTGAYTRTPFGSM
jgi:hypothetical protein